MGQIMDSVREWLTTDEWRFEDDRENDLIKTGIKMESATYRIFFDAQQEKDQLFLYVLCPNHIPEPMRIAAAEFITRANYGLKIGNFELDMDSGEVRYKVSVDVEDSRVTPVMVKNMMGYALPITDRYFPGLMTICYGGRSPIDAIKQIEQ
jgi:hypothetical protein